MKVLIKGAGDLASGIACRLYHSGFDIVMTDLEIPTAVRRTVAFSRAIYEDNVIIEGIIGRYCATMEDIHTALASGQIAVCIDPQASLVASWKPDVLVDAILAKKNLGTRMDDAALVIGVGPGFTAGRDCHVVIETKRGHYLGRCIYEGSAIPNTGIPGEIGGYSVERILRAPADGIFEPIVTIGSMVKQGDICGTVGGEFMRSQIPGVVRGLLQAGVPVIRGMKAGDVDPRCAPEHCHTVSDKARAIGGGVLEAILHHYKNILSMMDGK